MIVACASPKSPNDVKDEFDLLEKIRLYREFQPDLFNEKVDSPDDQFPDVAEIDSDGGMPFGY